MVRLKTLPWLAACLILLAGLAHAAAPGIARDEAALRAQTNNWVKAYSGGNAEAVAAEYAEDALLLPPGAPGVRGRAAIQAYFTKDIAGSKAAGVVFVIEPGSEVGVVGDLGWESGTFQVALHGAVVERGKFLSVSRKQKGKWSYIRDTWNTDTAPAAQP